MNSPPVLLPGPPFNVPIRRTRVYPQHLTTFSNNVVGKGTPFKHHCSAAVTNGVVSKPIEEQKQTHFPNSQTRSIKSTEDSAHQHWQRFLNRSTNLVPGRILNREHKDYEADTLTAELSLLPIYLLFT